MTQSNSSVRALVFKLSHMPLLFGIMEKMNLAGVVNDRIPKIGPHQRILSGSLFRIFCARYLSGDMPGGINSIQDFVCSLPANLLGVEASAGENPYELVNGEASIDLLDRIAEYGPARFQSEIISCLIDANSVEVAHLDSTSYYVYGEPQSTSNNEDFFNADNLLELSNKPLSLTHGDSRDNSPDLPKVNHLGVSAKVAGIEKAVLLYPAAFDGNMNDTARFQQFCTDGELSRLKQSYPNLKIIVGDAALASAKAIQSCHDCGIEIVMKLQDSKVKRDFADVNAGKIKLSSIEQPVPEGEKKDAVSQVIQYAWLEPECIKTQDKSDVCVQRILFVDESKRDKKTASLQAKAKKELQEVSAILNKLRTSPKSCKPDAMKAFKTLKSKFKLVTIDEPVYEEVIGKATSGRSKADAEKKVVAVRVIAKASINKDAVKAAINSALYYVLATTNMQRKHTAEEALELYKAYHDQIQMETQWRDLKDTGTIFDATYLTSQERINALLAIVSIALFVGRILITHVHDVLKARSLTLSSDNTPASVRPVLKTFIRCATSNQENSCLIVYPDFVSMPEDISESILYLVAMEIGEHATRLYSEEFYEHESGYIYNSLKEYRMKLQLKMRVR